jgi:hypothetical protein
VDRIERAFLIRLWIVVISELISQQLRGDSDPMKLSAFAIKLSIVTRICS